MKKLIASLSVLASVCAFGAYTDTMICCSTKGPDAYADGTTVLDGERYALVWAADTFDGFNQDGTLKDANDLVLGIAYAKSGRCPGYAFALPAAQFKQGGVVSLWMLDTRVQVADKADPTVVTTKLAAGLDKVAAAKEAGNVTITASGADLAGVTVGGEAIAPAAIADANLPKAQVKKIEIKDGKVYITVANTAAYINYGVTTGDKPDAITTDGTASAVSGNADEDIILVTDKKGDSQFFKVGQK